MKIAVVADGLGFGGTEKAIVNFSNLFYQMGHQVEVINLDPKKNELIGLLSTEIRILKFRLSSYSSPYLYYFGIKKWKWALYIVPFVLIVLRIFLLVIKLFRVRRTKYDVAIALSGHFNDLTFVAEGFVKAKKKVAWIHGSLSGYLHVSDGYSFLYKQFNKVVTISMYNHEIVMFANKWLKSVEFVKLYNPVNFRDLKIDPFIIKDLKERILILEQT